MIEANLNFKRVDSWRGPSKSFLLQKHGIKERMRVLHWVTRGPPTLTGSVMRRDHSWQVFCLAQSGMMWPLWWPLPRDQKTWRNPTADRQKSLAGYSKCSRFYLYKPLPVVCSQSVSLPLWQHRYENTTDWMHYIKVTHFQFLDLSGFHVCLFSKAGWTPNPGLEFNQQRSSLSHKEKALKSYYDAQSLHCFSVMLEHTVRYSNANAD